MKTDRYRVSASLNIKVGQTQFDVSTSFSRPSLEMPVDFLQVLSAFGVARTVDDAMAHLADGGLSLDEVEFKDAVAYLLEQGALVSVDDRQQFSAANEGFASIHGHYDMVADSERVLAYKVAIERCAKDKVVLEIGCGTGILSLFAAKAGARHVYAIEETSIGDIAQQMFEANGVADRVTLIRANSADAELPERADLLIHEIIGHDPVDENMLSTIDDARARLVRPGGAFLPYSIEVAVIGFESDNVPYVTGALAAAGAEEFGRRYELDFGPFARALLVEPQLTPTPTLAAGMSHFPHHKFITEPQVLARFDLSAPLVDQLAKEKFRKTLRVTRNGGLSGVFVFFRAALVEGLTVSNCPWVPLNHWGSSWRGFREAPARADEKVEIEVEILRNLQQMACHVGRVS